MKKTGKSVKQMTAAQIAKGFERLLRSGGNRAEAVLKLREAIISGIKYNGNQFLSIVEQLIETDENRKHFRQLVEKILTIDQAEDIPEAVLACTLFLLPIILMCPDTDKSFPDRIADPRSIARELQYAVGTGMPDDQEYVYLLPRLYKFNELGNLGASGMLALSRKLLPYRTAPIEEPDIPHMPTQGQRQGLGLFFLLGVTGFDHRLGFPFSRQANRQTIPAVIESVAGIIRQQLATPESSLDAEVIVLPPEEFFAGLRNGLHYFYRNQLVALINTAMKYHQLAPESLRITISLHQNDLGQQEIRITGWTIKQDMPLFSLPWIAAMTDMLSRMLSTIDEVLSTYRIEHIRSLTKILPSRMPGHLGPSLLRMDGTWFDTGRR